MDYPFRIKQRLVRRLPILLSFLVGGAAGWIIGSSWTNFDSDSSRGYEIRQSGYRYTNPLLECEIARNIADSGEIRPFKHKVEELVNEKIKSKKASHLSVYFRDLNNGPWFGINEKENFSPASLQKVPLLIAYLKQAESDPGILSRRLKYKGGLDFNIKENIKGTRSVEKGKSYTIEELLYMMIVYSDNNAWTLLMLNMDSKALGKIFFDLGVNIPNVRKPEDYMPVKAYASFFRVLFNASYLSREMSEKALEYLTLTEFRSGLMAGVPSNVVVAHKFGERSSGNNDEIKQLHDCGIIYYPEHPYLLCVMARGSDFKELADDIRDISNLVYEEVDGQ